MLIPNDENLSIALFRTVKNFTFPVFSLQQFNYLYKLRASNVVQLSTLKLVGVNPLLHEFFCRRF